MASARVLLDLLAAGVWRTAVPGALQAPLVKGLTVACETCSRRRGEQCVRVGQAHRSDAPPLGRSHPARVLAETFLNSMCPSPKPAAP